MTHLFTSISVYLMTLVNNYFQDLGDPLNSTTSCLMRPYFISLYNLKIQQDLPVS